MLTKEQIIANENHFAMMFRIANSYIWKDTGHVYTKLHNGKFKAHNLKSYCDLAEIVSQEFLNTHIELDSSINRRAVDSLINMIKNIAEESERPTATTKTKKGKKNRKKR